MAYDLAFIILIFIYMFYYFTKKVVLKHLRRKRYYRRFYDNKSCFNDKNDDDSKNSFIKQHILLEGLDNSPSSDILNDRYNPFKKSYTDNMLFSTIIERTNGDEVNLDYDDILLNELKNGSYSNDMDTKIYKKNQRTQSLARDNKTISAFSSRNSLVNSYKDELISSMASGPWWIE